MAGNFNFDNLTDEKKKLRSEVKKKKGKKRSK